MKNAMRATWMVCGGLSLLTGACLGTAEDTEGDIDSVSERLTTVNTLDEKGVVTKYNAQVTVAATSDHIFAAWVSSGNAQVVGEPFSTATGTPYGGKPSPGLTILSNTTRPKSFPAAAADPVNSNRALIVWQDDFSATDSDIWGAIVDDKGDLVPTNTSNPFTINFDGDLEKMPTVTYVRDADSFIVTYTRKVAAENRTALTTQWVSANGDVGGLVDAVSSGVSQTATPPTSAFVSNQGMIMWTWNENKYGFAPIEFTVIDPSLQFTVNGAQGIAAAGNPTPGADTYALAWRSGNNATAKIMGQILPNGCQAANCAQAPVTLISAGGSVTNLHNPVISAAHLGYGVFAGSEESVWKIKYKEMGGGLSGSLAAVTPTCPNPPGLQSAGGHSLGSSGGVIAVVSPSNPINQSNLRQFLLYDSFCSTPAKEMVAAPNADNVTDILNFNVSMN
jgi:hypothetical protein